MNTNKETKHVSHPCIHCTCCRSGMETNMNKLFRYLQKMHSEQHLNYCRMTQLTHTCHTSTLSEMLHTQMETGIQITFCSGGKRDNRQFKSWLIIITLRPFSVIRMVPAFIQCEEKLLAAKDTWYHHFMSPTCQNVKKKKGLISWKKETFCVDWFDWNLLYIRFVV